VQGQLRELRAWARAAPSPSRRTREAPQGAAGLSPRALHVSHDEPLALYNLGGDLGALRLCVALQMTSLEFPQSTTARKVARDGSVWPLNRNDMPWGSRTFLPAARARSATIGLRDYYRKLMRRAARNTALSRARSETVVRRRLLGFERFDAPRATPWVVAVNRAGAEASASVAAPAAWTGRRRRLTGAARPCRRQAQHRRAAAAGARVRPETQLDPAPLLTWLA